MTRFFLPGSLLLGLLMLSGCQHLASYECIAPARLSLPGVQRVAVVDFSGEHGTAISSAISSRLWNANFHTIVESSQLGEVQTASLSAAGNPAQTDVILAAARDAQIDGVLMGDVLEYRCEDERLSATHFGFGHGHERFGPFRSDGVGMHLSVEETLIREGTVTVAFRLVNPVTGEIIASDQVSHHYEGRLVNGSGSLPAPGEVLESLTNACVADIVAVLAPHEVPVSVRLVTAHWWQPGARLVRRGVDQAKRGDWEEAEKLWHEVLNRDPENDAALFNLAWVAARYKDFDVAEDRAMRALNLRHRDEYATGLEEIRRQREHFREAQRQREARCPISMPTVFQ